MVDDTPAHRSAAPHAFPATRAAEAVRPGGAGPSPAPLTIYDVARRAGVSIASVSRVLNGHATPRPETRERVLRAAAELGYVPDGAARALSSRLKEVVAVVFRHVHFESDAEPQFPDEAESLLFVDVINRGVEVAAQHRGYDLLMSSVDIHDHAPGPRIASLAGKSDGMILHDRVLTPSGVVRLADRVPVVTLAGTPTRASVNISGDNLGGMRELVTHLIERHGCRSVAYLSGHADSPDNLARVRAVREVAAQHGVRVLSGPQWTGEYSAASGARVIRRLLARGEEVPDAIACANDHTALGAMHALREFGYRIPDDVAVTGFDDLPIARHVTPALTTVRQPIQDLGATAFDVLYSMISGNRPDERQLVLPAQVVYRGSCGCPSPMPTPPGTPAVPVRDTIRVRGLGHAGAPIHLSTPQPSALIQPGSPVLSSTSAANAGALAGEAPIPHSDAADPAGTTTPAPIPTPVHEG